MRPARLARFRSPGRCHTGVSLLLSREDVRQHACLSRAGYNLLVGALLSTLAALPLCLDISGRAWGSLPSAMYFAVLAAAGLLLTAINRRRVDKMLIPPPSPCRCRVRSLWAAIVVVCVLLSAPLTAFGQERHLALLWLLGTGSGYFVWGRRSGMPAFNTLALVLFAGAAVVLCLSYALDSSTAAVAGLALWLACAAVGMAWCGISINRRYLWP